MPGYNDYLSNVMLGRDPNLNLDRIPLGTLAKKFAFQGGTFKRAGLESTSGSLERAPEAPDLVFRGPTTDADAISSFGSVERGLKGFGSHFFTMSAQAAEVGPISEMHTFRYNINMHTANFIPIE